MEKSGNPWLGAALNFFVAGVAIVRHTGGPPPGTSIPLAGLAFVLLQVAFACDGYRTCRVTLTRRGS